MTWATRWPGDPATSASPTPSTTAPDAAAIFTADMSDLAAPKARYTHRVVALAVRLVVEDGLPSPFGGNIMYTLAHFVHV